MSKTTIPAGGIADDAISEEHIDATVITGSTALAATPADTDELLISDAGTIKRIDYSHLKGDFVKLASGTTSAAANHDITGFIDTSVYNNYQVFLGNVKGQANNTVDLQFTDSSGVLDGADYWFSGIGWRSSDNALNLNGEGTNQISLTAPSSGADDHPLHCQFYITVNPNGNREGVTLQGLSWGYRSDVSDVMICNIMGWHNQTDTVTGFRLHASGNDNTTFDYEIYGLKK